MADIEKVLRVWKHMNLKTKLPTHYHEFLEVFDREKADTLPLTQGQEIDHQINLENTDGKKPELP